MKKIAIIGATGKLGIPTVKRLVENGVHVKAVVRNPESAKEKIPKGVEIIQGELNNVDSLKTALANTEYLYLNLSVPDPYADFIPEVHGVENILKATGSNLKQIIMISGLGALHPEFHPSNERIIDNALRVKGHKLIRDVGVPLTVFHRTWFINALPWFIQGESLLVFGKYKTPMYWTNTTDLADYITASIGNEGAYNKDFAMQGTEALSYANAARKYVELKNLSLSVIEAPVPEKDLGSFGDMLRYFENFEEQFCAQETHEFFGEPKLSIKEAIKQF